MARVNVMMSDELLEAVDHAATEKRLTRSVFPQKAASRYLEGKRLEQEAVTRKQRMEKAATQMDALADKSGKWGEVGTIRRFRDELSKTLQNVHNVHNVQKLFFVQNVTSCKLPPSIIAANF